MFRCVCVNEMGKQQQQHTMMRIGFFQIDPENLPLSDPLYRQSFVYAKYRIHGLDFRPHRNQDKVSYKHLSQYVYHLYQSHKTKKKTVVAYKGGVYERNLLQSLSIPCTNLETFPGCPTISKLNSPLLYPCANHRFCAESAHHCASAEVRFYRDWLLTKSLDA